MSLASKCVTIVNYGMGNVGSIANMLRKVGADVRVAADAGQITSATKLLLPGVGAFDAAMGRLESLGLLEPLNRRVLREGVPVLGLCLGMQLFMERSEEGARPGLGWIAGETVRFRFAPRQGRDALKIPHMGWNTLTVEKPNTILTEEIEPSRFYFVHSYHVTCADPEDVIGSATYGYRFPAAVKRNHIVGMQFHPEKSHRFGMQLLRNFVERFPNDT